LRRRPVIAPFSRRVLFSSHLLCLQHFISRTHQNESRGRRGNHPVKGRG
jgi:hypothetical protein